jgi:spermidine/putrescine transport system permease protein
MTKKTSLGGKLYTALVFIFLYAPIAVLIVFSFNSGKSTSVFEGFSLYWYKELFNDAATLTAFKNSMIVAVASSIITSVGAITSPVSFQELGRFFCELFSP